MRTTKSFPRRLTAGLLSIVMLLSLLPVLSTPAEAAQTEYAYEPNWYSWPEGEGSTGDTRMETLSMLLRYQKGNEAANIANAIDESLASYFDQYYTGDTLYIRLEHDIDVEVTPYYADDKPETSLAASTDFWKYKLPVYGKKVLDLNGHKIKVQQVNDNYQTSSAVFKILDGATLTIVDSKGGGKMIANSWIKMYLDLFHVLSGGELILNAPGATFECGYSEKVWLTDAYKDGEAPQENGYHGYARNQASGTAVMVRSGGKLTVAGGTVKGRGHSQITKHGKQYRSYQHSEGANLVECAAIEARAGSTVHIIDGNIYGMGCADALHILDGASLTIESGVFDTYKIDKVVLPKADRDGYSHGEVAGTTILGMLGGLVSMTLDDKVDNYMEGYYGNIGIPDHVMGQLAAKGSAVEVITGEHDVSGDELSSSDTRPATDFTTKRVTIRPKTGKATADARVSITPTNGMYSWNPSADTKNTGFQVNVSLSERYFTQRACELAANYYRPRVGNVYGLSDKDKEYFLSYKFTLYNSNGTKRADLGEKRLPAGSTCVTDVDLTFLTNIKSGTQDIAFDSSKWKALPVGDYIVRCEVTEVWQGEHAYKSAWYADMPLTICDGILLDQLVYQGGFQVDCDVYHSQDQYTEDGAQYMTIELASETSAALREAFIDLTATGQLPASAQFGDITVQYEARSYDPDGSEVNATSGATGVYGKAILASPGTGAKVITATVNLPRYDKSGNITGYDKLSASRNFLLLPKLDQWEGSRRNGEVYGYHEAAVLADGQSAAISPLGAMSDAMREKGTFSWQWWFIAGSHDMHPSVADLYSSDYSRYEPVQVNNTAELTQDGTYRLVCTYQPNRDGSPKQEFVSVPIDVTSSSTERVRVQLTASADSIPFSMEDLLGTELTLTCTGITSDIESVQFSMKGYPDGMYSRPVTREKNSSGKYTIPLSDFQSLADALEEEGDASGEYTFRAFVNCRENGVTRYKVYSDYVTVKIKKAAEGYMLTAEGAWLGAGQATLDEAEAEPIPLYLDSTSPSVTLGIRYAPANATYDPLFMGESDILCAWSVVSGTNCIRLGDDTESQTVKATIIAPGTSIIKFRMYTEHFEDGRFVVDKERIAYFKVCVPVTEVVFKQPVYSIGESYRDTPPSVTAKATCGASSPLAFDFKGSFAPVYRANGTSSEVNKVVAANDKGDVVYTLHLAEGQSYPLRKEREDSIGNATYVANTSAVKLTIQQSDGSTVTRTARDWGVTYDVDKDSCSLGSVEPRVDLACFRLAQDVFIKDKNATYIDVITITTTEPGVGDPINEKIKIYYAGGGEKEETYAENGQACKMADVFSLSNVKTQDGKSIILPYYSYVSKATSETAGAPYTDAEDAEKDGQKSWEYESFRNSDYENGTYFHEIQLVTNSNTAADGTKYYFSPNCKIILNGHLLDFGDRTMYTASNSNLTFKYFFDVGEVNTVSAIDLTGLTPRQGDKPATAADVTARGYAIKGGAVSDAQVDVTRVTWFYDSNGNGAYDEGEELKAAWKTETNAEGKKEITGYDEDNSTLWWDGTFLPGHSYSALVELGTDDSATRLAQNIEVNCDGKSILLQDGKRSFVVDFKVDMTIHTIHIPIPTGEAAASPDRDLLGLFDAKGQGYKVSDIVVNRHKDSSDGVSTVGTNISNFYEGGTDLSEQTLTEGRYWMTLSFAPKYTSTFADDLKVLINGETVGEFGYGKEQVKDLYTIKDSSHANVWRTFVVPAGSGVSVSGVVKSGNAASETTVRLMQDGMAMYTTTITGADTTTGKAFRLEGVAPGTYDLVITKPGHLTCTITGVTVGTEDIDLTGHTNASISAITLLAGDVNGDGSINIADLNLVWNAANYNKAVSDAADPLADLNGDGSINIADLNLVWNAANYNKGAADCTVTY